MIGQVVLRERSGATSNVVQVVVALRRRSGATSNDSWLGRSLGDAGTTAFSENFQGAKSLERLLSESTLEQLRATRCISQEFR